MNINSPLRELLGPVGTPTITSGRRQGKFWLVASFYDGYIYFYIFLVLRIVTHLMTCQYIVPMHWYMAMSQSCGYPVVTLHGHAVRVRDILPMSVTWCELVSYVCNE